MALPRGPQASRPTFSNSLICYIPSNFPRRFYLIYFTILISHSRRFDIFSTHISYSFSKKIFNTFFKNFLGPLPEPPRLTPTISEFPFSATYILKKKIQKIFSKFFWPLSRGPGAHAHKSQPRFTNIAQPYIPICTVAPRTLCNTYFPILFSKNYLSKKFWALPRGPWGFCPQFSQFPFSQLSTSFSLPSSLYSIS